MPFTWFLSQATFVLKANSTSLPSFCALILDVPLLVTLPKVKHNEIYGRNKQIKDNSATEGRITK